VTSFALITPSYYVDFEQCRWLCETVERHVASHVAHYLVVDRADRALFAPLASRRTRVVLKEDVLRGRLSQVPFARRWWVGWGRPPVRGWIVQQLVKLSMHEVAQEDVFVFVDSGAFFVRAYDPRDMLRGDTVPLFREHHEFFRKSAAHQRWHRLSAHLLGVRPVPGFDAGYIKTLVTWRRDNLVKLHAHIERVAGQPSFDTLARSLTLCEYGLYGMYCDMILGDRAGHYHTSRIETLSHWEAETLTVDGLARLRRGLSPDHLLVMVNEKSRTPPSTVRAAFAEA
jgi:hypothetical protein